MFTETEHFFWNADFKNWRNLKKNL